MRGECFICGASLSPYETKWEHADGRVACWADYAEKTWLSVKRCPFMDDSLAEKLGFHLHSDG